MTRQFYEESEKDYPYSDPRKQNLEYQSRLYAEGSTVDNTINYQEPVPDRVELQLRAFREQLDIATRLFATKNREYGGAIEETGVLGACVELVGIAARLKALVLRNASHGRTHPKELRDILTDAVNYGAIALIMLDTGNWEGQ